jgi:hypothetical protein
MLEHRTVELLGPYGLADPIVGRGTQIGTCEFRADGQAIVLDYAGGDGGSGFSQGLRRARLDLILGDPQFSRWFAHAYAGVTG